MLGRCSAILSSDFCKFLFAFRHTKSLLKMGFRVDLFSDEEKKKHFERDDSPENVYCPLKCNYLSNCSIKCRLYFISFGIIEPILVILKIESQSAFYVNL